MTTHRKVCLAVLLPSVVALSGCAAPKIDFSTIQRPPRPVEMDAYDTFVGSWNWHAELLNADKNKEWTGTAEWTWSLDDRVLHGRMSAKSGDTEFEAAGVWSWHPTKRKYIWWMFNNWGYPQEGTAKYDAETKSWVMTYTSVGLDGTTSHGRYEMKPVDENTLDWSMVEWADALHTIKKLEMTGTYTRKS